MILSRMIRCRPLIRPSVCPGSDCPPCQHSLDPALTSITMEALSEIVARTSHISNHFSWSSPLPRHYHSGYLSGNFCQSRESNLVFEDQAPSWSPLRIFRHGTGDIQILSDSVPCRDSTNRLRPSKVNSAPPGFLTAFPGTWPSGRMAPLDFH